MGKLKPALYYAIRRNFHSEIVAITSEKGSRNWHGRDCRYDTATHGTKDQLRGKFKTLQQAVACREKILKICERYESLNKELCKQQRALHNSQHGEIEELIKEICK